MKNLIIALFILVTTNSYSQTFYVNAEDPKSKTAFVEKLKYEGYKVIDSKTEPHDYNLNFFVDGQYKVTSLKKTHKAYATITDISDNELARSTEVKTNPAALNGFNASWGMAKMICNKQLLKMIEQVKKSK